MYNRLLTNKDISEFKNHIDLNGYREKFRHRELWDKNDALLKWIAVIKNFSEIEREGLDVVDLGCGSSCPPKIISLMNNNVTGIEYVSEYVGDFYKDSDVNVLIGDAFSIVGNMQHESVDVFYDCCSVTHFNVNYSDDTKNLGWRDMSELIYRSLRKGGYFIVSSDVRFSDSYGEFINPLDIIEIVERSGMSLVSKFNTECLSEIDNYSFEYRGMPMGVVSLVFKK